MEPSERTDPIDPKLRALFEREHAHVPDEPFSKFLMQRVAAERRRRLVARRVLQIAGLAAVVVLSPLLVAASQAASASLDALFALVEEWLSTPGGMLAAALCAVGALVIAALRRRPSIR